MRAAGVSCACAALCLAGCSKDRYKQRADDEAYKIVGDKSAGVPDMDPKFTIEQDGGWNPLDGLAKVEETDKTLGLAPEAEQGAAIVPLERALHIAVRQNRDYQNRKESLYLAALGLTLDRHRFTPIFGGSAEATYASTATDTTKASTFTTKLAEARTIINGVQTVTGTPAALLTSFADIVETAGNYTGAADPRIDVVREQSVNASPQFNINALLRGGGKIALSLTSNFLRFATGDARAASSTLLQAGFTQPLWRGAGRDIAMEQLTQGERDVLYAIREFTQFRKQFTVEICSQYYRVLQARDIARNAWRSVESFKTSLERERAFNKEGRRTASDLGRIEQAALDSQNRWVNATRDYKQALDEFKIALGLSTDANLILDDKVLDTLHKNGLRHPDIASDDALKVALSARLDLYNAHDRVEDAARKVKVAANGLGPDVTLSVTGSIPSEGADSFQKLSIEHAAFGGGLDVDLPFDRKAERNTYRTALIAQARAQRDAELAEDNVKLEVRRAWRNLEQAKRNFEVAQTSVKLNERRVEEQRLRSELGRATALDIVDAQNDLTAANNNLTAALVGHMNARLEFWRNMGILYIQENGQWEEVQDGFPHPKAA